MRIILLFVDGLGIGGADSTVNPCVQNGLHRLGCYRKGDHLLCPDRNGELIPVDATLDVPGLPQSATGQVTLLTGLNGAKILGRHLYGFPNQKLRDCLRTHSVLRQITDSGRSCDFLNTFRDPFFNLPLALKWRLSATTGAALAAGLNFHKPEDIAKSESLYHDITGESLHEKGFDVPILSIEEAAGVVAHRSRLFDLLLFEYFLTDRAGHTQDLSRAKKEIHKLDHFIDYILSDINLDDTLVIVTSDHGNIEDLSTKSHTRHPVMTRVWGSAKTACSQQLSDLTDVTPAILNLMGIHDRPA